MSGIQDSCWSRDERAFLTGMSAADPGSVHTRSNEELRSLLDENRHRWDQSRLYFEAHVNFASPGDQNRGAIDGICQRTEFAGRWRQATFEMHKDREPTGFVTGRSPSLATLTADVGQMVERIGRLGVTVLRWKIEDTLQDSNRGDTL